MSSYFHYFYCLLKSNNQRGTEVNLVPDYDTARRDGIIGFRFEMTEVGSEQGGSMSAVELSGGQKALLGMALVFSILTMNAPRGVLDKLPSTGGEATLVPLPCCSGGSGIGSPLYLLDEVDAALDESNQKLVARVIYDLFKTRCQVICISHHAEFQKYATSVIRVLMQADGCSQIECGQ